MKELTPTLLADKIKQLLSAGEDLEKIQTLALAQGVDPILFSEALDIIQGKVTESMEVPTELVKKRFILSPRLLIYAGVSIGLIVVVFLAYVWWARSQAPEISIQPPDLYQRSEVAENPNAFEPNGESNLDLPINVEAINFVESFDLQSLQLEDDFFEAISSDLNLSNTTVTEDNSSRGSQLIAEDEELEDTEETPEDEGLIAEVEVGKYEIKGLPRTVKIREPYDFEVIVYDTDGNIITDFNQTIQFRSTALSITINPEYTFKLSDEGVAVQTVTFGMLGKHTLAVNTKGNPSQRAQTSVRVRD